MPEWLNWVWRAWWRLSRDRPHLVAGLGKPVPQAIPWRDVQRWARAHGYGSQEASFMDECFMKMDEAYFEWWRAQQPPPQAPRR